MSIGLGFAGVGWLGESLLKELPEIPELRLAAIQDASGDLASDIGQRYGSPWVGTSFEGLLAAPDVDAVVISTPNGLHAPQAGAALRAGKHVLVQKPLATTPADARSLVEQAHLANRLLFVDYSYRFLETVQVFEEVVREIGAIRRIEATFHNIYGPGKAWFFDPRLSGGGALVDLGVHLLDLSLALTNPREAVLERADLSYSAGHPVENAATLDLRLDETACRLDVSWNATLPETEIAVRAECERGTACWENVDGSFFRFRTLRDTRSLVERETTLRADTLRTFLAALHAGKAPAIDLRVYDLLAQAYAGARGG